MRHIHILKSEGRVAVGGIADFDNFFHGGIWNGLGKSRAESGIRNLESRLGGRIRTIFEADSEI